MNTEKEKLDHIINILSALRDGKEIQCKMHPENHWNKSCLERNLNNLHYLSSKPECYRIKPEPREWFVVLKSNCFSPPATGLLYINFLTRESAQRYVDDCGPQSKSIEIIHVREVI
jgi:hypothetical protein